MSMVRNVLVTMILCSAAGAAAADLPKISQRWAVLVGVDEYAYAQKLQYCGADQRAFRDQLVASGFPSDQVFLLHDGATDPKFRPSQRNIERQLNLVLNLADADDLVIVGFSGHGVHLDGKSFLCPGDCTLDDPATLIGVDGVYDRLQKCAAQFKLVVVDACRNDPRPGGARSMTSTDGTRALARSLQDLKLPEGVVLLNSCAPGEVSWEDPDFGHGVFMNYVLEGLQGAADAGGDGHVSLMELQSFAANRTKTFVANRFSVTQRPFFKGDLSGEALEYALLPVGGKGTPKPIVGTPMKLPPAKLEPFVVTSCRQGKEAYESDELQSAVFAHCLKAGLRGDADANTDGELTNVEFYEYLRRHVPGEAAKLPGVQQEPELVRGTSAPEFGIKPVDGKGWAVVVGASDYEQVPDIRFGSSDAEAVADELIRAGFAKERVIRITDQAGKASPSNAPTRRNIINQLFSLSVTAKEDDVVVLFFAGQGIEVDGVIYLCPSDVRKELTATMITLDEVCRMLQDCKARRIVVLCDSCRSVPSE